MKKGKQILVLIMVVFLATTANAQLKGLGKQLGKKALGSNATKTEETKNESATEKVAEEKKLELDWTTFSLAPAITMNSLLYGTQVFNSGTLRLNTYTASFIPYKKVDGSTVSSIYDRDEFLKTKVYKDGTLIKEISYDGGSTFEDNKLRKFINDNSDISLKETGVGMYRVDFYAADKMFYSFEFETYKLTNSDPYAKLNEMYLSRGPWNKYAYLEHQKSGNLIFGLYMNHEEFFPNPSDNNKTLKPISWTLNISKDGKPYATHYGMKSPKKDQIERGEWKTTSTALKSVDGTTTITLAGLTDGAYKVELKIDIEEKPRMYSFSVKDKRIVLMPEQDRATAEPTKLIEGWNNFFWLKQEN